MATTRSSEPTKTNQEETTWHGFDLPPLPEVSAWVGYLGRAGHIAKGVVYFVVGWLAFQLAIGSGGEVTGARGAIREIGQQPFGRILLGVTAAGLLAYTLWRSVQAAMNTDGHEKNTKGTLIRAGYVISGIIYLALACFAGARALRIGGGQGGTSMQRELLQSGVGWVLLGCGGLVIMGLAVFFLYQAYDAGFMRRYDWSSMSPRMRTVALRVGRAGLATRGIAFAMIGWFLVSAAYQGTSTGQISGLGDALATIAAQYYGRILLGLTGAGLMCYGVHMILLGWYRRFNIAA